MYLASDQYYTTTKLRVVFDASAKTVSRAYLNNQFLVGPTIHTPLTDVLIWFQHHKIALTTNVSNMYRAVILPDVQQDLHRFVWRVDLIPIRGEHGA